MLSIVEITFKTSKEETDFLSVLNEYARDIMGGGKDLPDATQQNLVPALKKIDHKIILIAYNNSAPIGLANCFLGFSTFKAKPLLNIHDFVVVPSARKKGIARLLLNEIQLKAKEKGCCKITLEVLEGNKRAQKIYKDFGFEGYELDPKMGKAIFLDKEI